MIKKDNLLFGLLFTVLMSFFVMSCVSDEVESGPFPLVADIFNSVDGKQVAFQGLTHSAVSWTWDFGDGTTSTEQNPVHVYADGGFYLATLTATGADGTEVVTEVNLAIAVTPYVLLTGGPTATNGRTWRLTAAHPPSDKFANPDIDFTYATDVEELPASAFDLYLQIGEIYEDEFTFNFNGDYSHDVKDDGATFAGLLYASVLADAGGTTILKTTGELITETVDILAITTYAPEDGAKFVFTEEEDFTIGTLPDFATGVDPNYGFPIITYPGVATIDFPDSTEFIGIQDFQRKVIVLDISADSMQLAMFLTLDPAAVVSWNPLIPLSTTVLVLTFEIVD